MTPKSQKIIFKKRKRKKKTCFLAAHGFKKQKGIEENIGKEKQKQKKGLQASTNLI